MKIKPSVNKNVTAALKNCREVLVSETIGLLKQIGVEQGQDVLFERALFLYQHKGNTTETIVCDRIAYVESRGGNGYYLVSMGKDEYVAPASDTFMTIDSLRAVYEEVRRVVGVF